MDVIKTLSVLGFLSTSLFGQLTIDGQWKPVEPVLQPTIEVVSPFGLELAVGDNDIVTWTWDKGLNVWKTKENRLDITCPNGTYRVNWLKRTINFQDGRIDRESGDLVFRVGESSTPPTTPEDPPTSPPTDPVPSPEFKELQELAVKAVQQTGDKDTANKIGNFYLQWAASASPSRPISTLKHEVRRGLGDVLVVRDGDADWEQAWRIPASAILEKYPQPKDYIKAIEASGKALRFASTQNRTLLLNRGTIYFYTSSNPTISCSYCVKWKNQEMSKFIKAGYKVIERVTDGAVPAFKYITPDGRQSKTMTGYLPYTTFQNMLKVN